MRCGLWIDHRRAILVRLDGDEVIVETLDSSVPPRTRRAGGTAGGTAQGRERGRSGQRAGGPQQALPEDRLDRKHEQTLQRYYRRVADALGRIDALYVLGPGEAPGEFVKILDLDPDWSRTGVEVERADKMTEPQLVARVRAHFGRPAPRGRHPDE